MSVGAGWPALQMPMMMSSHLNNHVKNIGNPLFCELQMSLLCPWLSSFWHCVEDSGSSLTLAAWPHPSSFSSPESPTKYWRYSLHTVNKMSTLWIQLPMWQRSHMQVKWRHEIQQQKRKDQKTIITENLKMIQGWKRVRNSLWFSGVTLRLLSKGSRWKPHFLNATEQEQKG